MFMMWIFSLNKELRGVRRRYAACAAEDKGINVCAPATRHTSFISLLSPHIFPLISFYPLLFLPLPRAMQS